MTAPAPDIIDQAAVLRRGSGLSREDFCVRYGLPFSAYSQWESRRRKPHCAAVVLLRLVVSSPEVVERLVQPLRRVTL
jgi:DNA-binding transcriptional regulator YiaG